MFISEDITERVREANDIAEVISEAVPHLKRVGKDFKALCPFHQEKTPSFMVSPAKGIFHCFGCGVGGDVFKFVMQLERLSYPEAIRKLAERKGIPIQETASSAAFSKEHQKRKRLLELIERASAFYHRTLLESKEAKEALRYLQTARALKRETIEKFQLGWAPSEGRALLKSASKIGFTAEDLKEAGLVHQFQDGRWVDWFRGRILFPILDVKGQTVGFGGRILESKEIKSQNPPPKYINTVETSLFQKGKNLYGFYQGSKAIRNLRHAVVLEGYMDVIACHQAGVENTVAPLGTALTQDQCQLLKRYVEEVTLMFDPDLAGTAASLRSAELLLELGFYPMISRLPKGEDVDEYLQKHSKEELEKLIRSGLSMVEFKLDALLRDQEKSLSVVKKLQACQSLFPMLLKVESEIVKAEILKLMANRLNLKEELLYAEFKKLRSKSGKRASNWAHSKEKSEEVVAPGLLKAEEELLFLALRYSDLRSEFIGMAGNEPELFSKELIEYAEVLKKFPESGDPSPFLSALDDSSAAFFRKLLFREIAVSDPQNLFESVLKQVKNLNQEKRRKELEKEMVELLNRGERLSKKQAGEYQELTKSLKGTHSMGFKYGS